MCEQCDPKNHAFEPDPRGSDPLLCRHCMLPTGEHRERVRIRIGVGIPVDCCPSCGSGYFEADTGYCQMCRTHTERVKTCPCCGRQHQERASYCGTCHTCDGECVTVENIRGVD